MSVRAQASLIQEAMEFLGGLTLNKTEENLKDIKRDQQNKEETEERNKQNKMKSVKKRRKTENANTLQQT